MVLDLGKIAEEAARSVERYNEMLKLYHIPEAVQRMAEQRVEAERQFKPLRQIIESPSFKLHLQLMQKAAEDAARVLNASRNTTLPVMRALQDLYGTIDAVAVDIAKENDVPEEKREEVITRPLFSETKVQIRRGTPSVKYIVPLELPSDTAWDDVQARFVDPQNLFYEIPKHSVRYTADYREMGMEDARTKLPNSQWKLLRALAQYGGKISWRTPAASPKVKKNKQLLAQTLKNYFCIEGDPFGVYREEKAYRLKMALIPDPSDARPESDSEAYFRENTGEVYDPHENDPKRDQ